MVFPLRQKKELQHKRFVEPLQLQPPLRPVSVYVKPTPFVLVTDAIYLKLYQSIVM